jgi:hypothetical protein
MSVSVQCSVESSAAGGRVSGGLGEAERLVREAMMLSLNKPEFLAATPRATAVQSVGKIILASNAAKFKKFSQDLLRLLNECFQIISKCRSNSGVYGRNLINSPSKIFLVYME